MEVTKPTTIKIIRTSIHTFLRHYPHFTTTTLFSLPFSASIFLSATFRLQSTFHFRLRSLFAAARLPPDSPFFSLLALKLSQTIASLILILPFTLSFLLVAKASIIRSLNAAATPRSFAGIFSSVLRTQLWSSSVVVAANATCFCLLFVGFTFLEAVVDVDVSSSQNLLLFLSAAAGIGYSVVLAHAFVVCNLAVILSGMEGGGGGYVSILKACVLIKGRTSTALSLALPINAAMASVEWLFQFRLSEMRDSGPVAMVLEGFFVAYLYSILITLDTITGCVFYKSCQTTVCEEDGDYGSYCLEIKDDEDQSVFAYEKLIAKELS